MNEKIISILEEISQSDTLGNRINALRMIKTKYENSQQGHVLTFDNGKIILLEWYYPYDSDTPKDIELELYKSLLSLTLAYINKECGVSEN